MWTSHWSRSTGRSKVLVEVKSVGPSTEKVELIRTQIFMFDFVFLVKIFDLFLRNIFIFEKHFYEISFLRNISIFEKHFHQKIPNVTSYQFST